MTRLRRSTLSDALELLALAVAIAAAGYLAVFALTGCAANPDTNPDILSQSHKPIQAVDTTPLGVPYVQYTFYWGEGGATTVQYTVQEESK